MRHRNAAGIGAIGASSGNPVSTAGAPIGRFVPGVAIPDHVIVSGPTGRFHTRQLVDAHAKLPDDAAERWIWWKLPTPAKRKNNFVDLLEEPLPEDVWRTDAQTKSLLAMMSPINREKVKAAQKTGKKMVGCV